jgi:hypothetical protein
VPQITVELRGLEGISRDLKALPDRVRKKVLERAVHKGADIIEMQAMINAPRGGGRWPHRWKVRLAKSIISPTVWKKKMSTLVRVGVDTDKTSRGHLLEWGHRMVVGGKLGQGGRSVGFVPGTRWMTRAYDSRKREAASRIESEIIRGVMREAKK